MDEGLKLQKIEKILGKIYTFLTPLLPLANAHATDFITKGYWDTLLPAGIKDQLLTLSKQELSNLPSADFVRRNPQHGEETALTEEKTKYMEYSFDSSNSRQIKQTEFSETNPSKRNENLLKQDISFDCYKSFASKSEVSPIPYKNIDDFLQQAYVSTIEGSKVAIAPEEVLLGIKGDRDDMFISTFMNQKKCHEVEIMSKICAALARYFECKMVVDFGSGKGYLGKHLSLQYQLPVLGIDAASTNTQAAKKRNIVLDKQWSSLSWNKQLESDGTKMTKKVKKYLKLRRQNRQSNEAKADIENENLATGETIDVKDNVISKAVIKSDLSETAFDLSEMDVGEMVNTSNEEKFVPCTTFINKETNFINLAKVGFPDLFIDQFQNIHEKRYSLSETTELNCPPEKLEASSKICGKRPSSGEYLNSQSDCNDSKISTESNNDGITEHNSDNSKTGANIGDTCKPNAFIDVAVENKTYTTNYEENKINDNETDEKKAHKSKDCENIDNVSNAAAETVDIRKTKGYKTDVSKAGANEVNENNTKFRKTDRFKPGASSEFRMMLVGLHTCGNLASTSMEVFVNSDQLQVLCNIGCCYHLLHEKYLDTDISSSESGFPLSRFLNERQFKLGNTARNLASQSIHRVSDFDMLQGERFYLRALLEVLIKDVCGENVVKKGLRKLEQKCQTTHEYLRRACDKLGISDKVTDDMIDVYMRKYSSEKHKLAAFFQLKAALAPCIESLIIVDRVCYLLEQDYIKNVVLVQMFDPIISPRCYGIIAMK